MKFETAPREYWINAGSFDEAKMYLLFLDIDGKRNWRLPTRFERAKYFRQGFEINFHKQGPWDHLDENTILLNGTTKLVIPIRDL